MRTYQTALFVLFTLLPIISYSRGLPSAIMPPGEKMVVVDPRTNKWGAYTGDGMLIRSGVASTGKNWCSDIGRPCRTKTGVFRVYFLGDSSCYSSRFPIPNGGAPMPYCMYFNGNQALHGSGSVGNGHLSHGCVRLHVSDARWLRFNFVEEGTIVKVLPY